MRNFTKRDDRRWRGARQLRCEVFVHECADRAGFTSSSDASGERSVRLFVEQRDKPKKRRNSSSPGNLFTRIKLQVPWTVLRDDEWTCHGMSCFPNRGKHFYVPIGGEGNQWHAIEAFALATFCERRSRHCETSGVASHIGNIERAARRHHVHDGSGRERTSTIFGRQNRVERQPAARLCLPEANGHR